MCVDTLHERDNDDGDDDDGGGDDDNDNNNNNNLAKHFLEPLIFQRTVKEATELSVSYTIKCFLHNTPILLISSF
jgi:hypothetical protein